MDFIHKSCKGNLLPDFDTWFKEMVGDGQASDIGGGDSLRDGEVQAQVQTGAQGAGVRAQGGEVMGEEAGGEGGRGDGGQGGVVHQLVRRLEGGKSTKLKLPRFVKPSGRRGVRRDGLVQMRIESLVASGEGGRLTGLITSGGKRKLPADSDSPNAKTQRL